MAGTTCSDCGSRVPTDDWTCPECGNPVESTAPDQTGQEISLRGMVTLLLLFIFIPVLLFLLHIFVPEL